MKRCIGSSGLRSLMKLIKNNGGGENWKQCTLAANGVSTNPIPSGLKTTDVHILIGVARPSNVNAFQLIALTDWNDNMHMIVGNCISIDSDRNIIFHPEQVWGFCKFFYLPK